MSNAAKLKKKAAEFEQKKQLDKALVLYRQILDSADPSDPDVDVGLFNRVGDLLMRQGNVPDAVNYYEKAVDLYAEGGFFNNAIALCNKILRQSPGRSSIYYKLGKISARKGFKADAKQNFLEYADRMQKAGQLDEAFRALKEFADLCPDQDDIRLMLADQLAKRDRKTEALEQLQTLYERFEQEGRATEARATVDRMRAIDPDAEPKAATDTARKPNSSDLVFLDVDYDAAPPPRRFPPRATVKLTTPLESPPTRSSRPSPISDLPLIDPGPLPPLPHDAPLEPVEFAALRLGTPMDMPAIGGDPAHDLALPGDLPDLDTDSPPDGLDLVMPDDEPVALDEPSMLDGLVPPIARATTEQPSRLDTEGLDIQHSAAGDAIDFDSMVVPQDLGVESTMLGDAAVASPDVAPLAGFEQTVLDDAPSADAGFALADDDADVDYDDVSDAADDGLLMISDDLDGDTMLEMVADEPIDAIDDEDRAGELTLVMPDEPELDAPVASPSTGEAPSRVAQRSPSPLDDGERSTRVLSPAELAALDAAARRAVAPPEPRADGADSADAAAPEVPDDAYLVADDLELDVSPAAPVAPAALDDGALTLLDDDLVESRDDARASVEPASRDQREATGRAAGNGTGDPLGDLPMLDVGDAMSASGASGTARDGARAGAEAGVLDAGALELVGGLPVGADASPAAGRAARLGARVESEPHDLALRREWAEALLGAGDRERGLQQLDATMVAAERASDLELARAIADEVIRVDRDSVRHHQKRVEYAFRTADRPRLVNAYLELADALFRTGQADKARVVYHRVLELAPDDLRASTALASIGGATPPRPSAATRQTTAARRYTGEASRLVTPPETIVPVAPAPRESRPVAEPPRRTSDEMDFVNLGDLLREDDAPKNTRMVVAEQAPTGNEQADFADMLRKFKQGVAENVEEEDYESHYDLGVAYKEMGLVDEAIAEFQKALRGPHRRVRTYEALGQCFLEKKQWQVASTILQRADAEPGHGDEQLVGVLYLLGYAMEAMQKPQEALTYYQRVFAVDIQFRDVSDRIGAVEKVPR